VLDDGVILRSQANLVASRAADWSPQSRETARIILDHIAARARANKYREVRTRLPAARSHLLTEAHKRFGVGVTVRRADLVGHAHAALPAGRSSMR
jgi:ATP phosphoribosyltransferase